VPVAAFAELQGGRITLAGLVGSVRDGRQLRAHDMGDAANPEELGRRVARSLLAQGAGALIATEGNPDSGAFRS
jgi:hydroxymethylbilane synthase